MAEQEKKLAEILRPNRFVHVMPTNPFKLNKVFSFGEPVHDKRIQFEWPTDKVFDLMPERDNLRITNLTLKFNEEKQLISVQCSLSNGMNSPTYKSLLCNSTQDQLLESTIEVSEDRPVHSVRILNENNRAIVGITFLDSEGGEIGKFDPGFEGDQRQIRIEERTLDENQELVGIYGVKDESKNITTFGFITKVNRERQDLMDRVRASQASVKSNKPVPASPQPTPAATANPVIVTESQPIAVASTETTNAEESN